MSRRWPPSLRFCWSSPKVWSASGYPVALMSSYVQSSSDSIHIESFWSACRITSMNNSRQPIDIFMNRFSMSVQPMSAILRWFIAWVYVIGLSKRWKARRLCLEEESLFNSIFIKTSIPEAFSEVNPLNPVSFVSAYAFLRSPTQIMVRRIILYSYATIVIVDRVAKHIAAFV